MTSPDVYVATEQPREKRIICPKGPQSVTAVDGIFLGLAVDQYEGKPPRLVEKYALVFVAAAINPETGRNFELSREFTVTMAPKSNLRKFLQQWRNRDYTDEEAKNVPLHKVVGQSGMALIEHKTSAAGNEYAKLASIMPLPEGMAKVVPQGYERAPWWEDKKKEYLAAADAFLAMQAAQEAARQEVVRQAANRQPVAAGVGADPGFPAALKDDNDSDLPF